MEYITRLGEPITLDPSGCAVFGFESQQRIKHPTGGLGTVIGTAYEHHRSRSGKMLLWCKFDRSKTPNVVLNSQKPELLQPVH